MKMKLFLVLLSSLCFQQASASGCFSDEYESKVNDGLNQLSELSSPINSMASVFNEFNDSVQRNGANRINIQAFNESLDLTHGTLKNSVDSLDSFQRILNKGFKNDKDDVVCANRFKQVILTLNEVKSSLLVADIKAISMTMTTDRIKFALGLQTIGDKLNTVNSKYSEFLRNAEKLKQYKENNESVVYGSVAELVELLNEPNYVVMVILPGNKSISAADKEDFSNLAGRVAKNNDPALWKVFVVNKNLNKLQKKLLALSGDEEIVIYGSGTGLTSDRVKNKKTYNFSDMTGAWDIYCALAGVI